MMYINKGVFMRISLKKIWNKIFMPRKVKVVLDTDFGAYENVTDYLHRISKTPEIANAAYSLSDLGASFSDMKKFALLLNDNKEEEAFNLLLKYVQIVEEEDNVQADRYMKHMEFKEAAIEASEIVKEGERLLRVQNSKQNLAYP